MKQTDANVVEYLSAVNQLAEDNKTHKPKQQTAVEWLVSEIKSQLIARVSELDLHSLEQQAKAMEKEQIKNAIICNQNGLLRRKTVLEAEQYYNETYGTK